MFPMTVKLVGVTHRDAQQNIKTFGCPDIGSYALEREPFNPHDPNAIRVAVGGYFMGYIPNSKAQLIAPLMDSGRSFLAELVQRNEHPHHEIVGLTVRIIETTHLHSHSVG